MTDRSKALDHVEARPEVWLRRPWLGKIAALIWSTWGILGTALLARSFDGLDSPSGQITLATVLGTMLALLFCTIGPFTFAWRSYRAGLWIGADAIRIRGPFRSWTIPYSEAVEFRPGINFFWLPIQGGGPQTPCVELRRYKRSPVGASALAVKSDLHYPEEAQPMCDRLNPLLKAHWHAGEPDDGPEKPLSNRGLFRTTM